MNAALPPILAIALTLGLAACADSEPARPQSPGAPALSAPAKVAPPPAPEAAPEGGAAPAVPPPSPEGTAPGQAAPAERPARQRGPDEADVADCHRYARATIEHDRRIERDRGDAGGFGSLGGDVGAFSDQLSRVGEGSTYQRTYDTCMSSKGYSEE